MDCVACHQFRIGFQDPEELAEIPSFYFPDNRFIRKDWLAFLAKHVPKAKITNHTKLCLLHFHKSDILPGPILKPTAVPQLYGPPNKLLSLLNYVIRGTSSNGHQTQKRKNHQDLLDVLRKELSTTSCADCEKCAKIFSETIHHLQSHRTAEKAPESVVVPTIEINDADDPPQQVMLFVKNEGNTRLYRCPCCPTEMKYPEIITHILSHEGATVGGKRTRLADGNEVIESIDLVDDDDEVEPTEKSSVVLAKMNFRAKKQGRSTAYVCNVCDAEVEEDIVSHYAMHQLHEVEDELPQIEETVTASSDDEEEEEILIY